jgi:hypothetical protein
MMADKSAIASFLQATVSSTQAQISHSIVNVVCLLLPFSRPSSAYLAQNRIVRIVRISPFQPRPLAKKVEKLDRHSLQQNAEMNERSQI